MRSYAKSFFTGFFLMALVLAPLLWCFWLYSAGQRRAALASQSQSGVTVVAGAQNITTALLAVAGDSPAFVLLRLDCPADTISLMVVPEVSVLVTPGGPAFLRDSYTAAGPARAKALLAQTLRQGIDCYLAAAPEGWKALLPGQTARVNTANLLNNRQRSAAGLTDPVAELAPGGGEPFVAAAGDTPTLRWQLRAAVWEAFIRQNVAALPDFPDALRAQSGRLLTDLTAVDLLELEDTLTYLAAREPTVEYGVLPGTRDAYTGRFEFGEDTLAAAEKLLG